MQLCSHSALLGGRATTAQPQLRGARHARLAPRAAIEKEAPAAASAAELTADTKPAGSGGPVLNLIPHSRWADGVPPVMGGHLMASSVVSPLSTSKAPGRSADAFKFYYPAGEAGDVAVMQFINPAAAAKGLAQMLAEASAAAIAERGSFTVALSGGSLLGALAPLAERRDVDFDNWHVFFADERNVPLDSGDSNYAGAAPVLAAAGVPESQIYSITPGLSVEQAAISYAGRMLDLPESVLPRSAEGQPVLDAVLLGVGPDGHVASLFPNRSTLADASSWVLPVANSPKPPAERITLSLPAINAAKRVLFVATGAGKADVVQRVLEVQTLPGALPAQLVRPAAGTTTWVLDTHSAQELHCEDWQNAKAFPRSTLAAKK